MQTQRSKATPLRSALGDVQFGEGARTTLRVPDAVAQAAQELAKELGTTKNDAIVRLALAGARVLERAREVAERREARWDALLVADAGATALPHPEEMRAASFALRDNPE
ncbi:MAG: hypothetical protein M3321_01225 [Actinomycetota bacterium]|nr:hypothetical protein [Actinomycetota bacterium]